MVDRLMMRKGKHRIGRPRPDNEPSLYYLYKNDLCSTEEFTLEIEKRVQSRREEDYRRLLMPLMITPGAHLRAARMAHAFFYADRQSDPQCTWAGISREQRERWMGMVAEVAKAFHKPLPADVPVRPEEDNVDEGVAVDTTAIAS